MSECVTVAMKTTELRSMAGYLSVAQSCDDSGMTQGVKDAIVTLRAALARSENHEAWASKIGGRMQSHDDREWKDSVNRKASAMQELGLSHITGGSPGEPELARWCHEQMTVIKRPDDEHQIVRVSVGGSEQMDGAYCVFRGDILQCRSLLQQAINALNVHCP